MTIKIGGHPDFTRTSPDPTDDHRLAQVVDGEINKEYTRVRAGAAILAGAFCAYDPSTGYAYPIVKSAIETYEGLPVGVAEVAFTSGDYGFIMTQGLTGSIARVGAVCAKRKKMYPTASAGRLDDAAISSTDNEITGVTVLESAGASIGVALVKVWIFGARVAID